MNLTRTHDQLAARSLNRIARDLRWENHLAAADKVAALAIRFEKEHTR